MARVRLEAVTKLFRGGAVGVKDVSLDIAHGEFVTLVGPSGCGKSTTLQLLAGLDTPTSGTIRIDEQVVNTLSPRDRDIALVFQSYALYPHMDVRRNIAFPLENLGMDRKAIDERVRETAAMLELEPLLSRKPRELSGGQRQRVALGRALVRRPKLFLFDEPLSNLDVALRTQMRAELKRLHQRLKATFIYVTHDQAEAMTLSDRVVVMSQGTVQQVGPPREVYERPSNVFVARFFGSPAINLVKPATVGLGGAGLVGVRAEHLDVTQPSGIDGVVDLVEPMGAENWITLRIGEEQLTARAPSDFVPSQGVRLFLRVNEAHLLRFDDSGRRIQ